MFSSESKWAAIIYGRTYEVDFRFITMPEDFTPDDISWARAYILATTRSAHKLFDRTPRWSLFKNERYCIIGVTCMAREIEDREEYTKDKGYPGRPLYLFAGYATKLGGKQDFPPIPAYSDNIEFFKPLYDDVIQKWDEKIYDQSRHHPILSQYQALPDFDSDSKLEEIELNYNPDKAILWPNSDVYKLRLWQAAVESKEPISLCLGLASQRDIENSLFLNGTAFDVTQQLEITHPLEKDEQKEPKNQLSTNTRYREEGQQKLTAYGGKFQNETSPVALWLLDPKKVAAIGGGLVAFAVWMAIATGNWIAGGLTAAAAGSLAAVAGGLVSAAKGISEATNQPTNNEVEETQIELDRAFRERYRDYGFKPKLSQPEVESDKHQLNTSENSDISQDAEPKGWF